MCLHTSVWVLLKERPRDSYLLLYLSLFFMADAVYGLGIDKTPASYGGRPHNGLSVLQPTDCQCLF